MSCETFRPTSKEPVKEVVIGRLEDGSEVRAFGVVHYYWSREGKSVMSPSWAWYLNRTEALRHQLVEAYRYNHEAQSWMHYSPDENDLRLRFERRVIGQVDGVDVVVYRYPVREPFGVLHWRIGHNLKEALRMQRRALWHYSYRSISGPDLVYPDPEDPNAQIPEIVQYRYGTCVETGEALIRYGMFWMRRELDEATCWFETHQEAMSARAEAQARLRMEQERCQLERDKKDAVKVYSNACRQTDTLTAQPWYAAARAMVDRSIVDAYDAAHFDPPEWEWDTPAEYLANIRRYEEVLHALQKAVDDAYLAHLVACDERKLVTRVGEFLDHWYPTCPLCGKEYKRGDFETSVSVGELLITGCECPEYGWDRSAQHTPAVVSAALKALNHPWDTHPSELHNGTLHNGHVVITISAVQYRGEVLARFVLVYHNLYLRPALLINTNAWLQLPMGPSVAAKSTFESVWEQVTLPAVRRAEYQRAEKYVEEGRVKKIAFRFSENSGRWYADVHDSCGRRRFVVDPRKCSFPVEAGVLYYCRVDPQPDNWRPGVTEYVWPYLEVPRFMQEVRSPWQTKTDQFSSTPVASRGKGGFGTIGDLLRERLKR